MINFNKPCNLEHVAVALAETSDKLVVLTNWYPVVEGYESELLSVEPILTFPSDEHEIVSEIVNQVTLAKDDFGGYSFIALKDDDKSSFTVELHCTDRVHMSFVIYNIKDRKAFRSKIEKHVTTVKLV